MLSGSTSDLSMGKDSYSLSTKKLKSVDLIISSNQILIGKSELDVTKEILELVNNKIKKFEIKYDN